MHCASMFSSLAAHSSLPGLLSLLSGTLLKHLNWGFAGCEVRDVPPSPGDSVFLSSYEDAKLIST